MAPEQLEGRKPIPAQTSSPSAAFFMKWSQGKKAFEGKSQVSLIGAILEREPTPVSALQPASPPRLDVVIKRCLAKDPDERWHSAGDLAVGLQWLKDASAVPKAGSMSKPARVSKFWLPVAAVFFITTAALAAILIYDYKKPGESAMVRFFVPAPDKTVLIRE
jgi:serine/threonine protein kinase